MQIRACFKLLPAQKKVSFVCAFMCFTNLSLVTSYLLMTSFITCSDSFKTNDINILWRLTLRVWFKGLYFNFFCSFSTGHVFFVRRRLNRDISNCTGLSVVFERKTWNYFILCSFMGVFILLKKLFLLLFFGPLFIYKF